MIGREGREPHVWLVLPAPRDDPGGLSGLAESVVESLATLARHIFRLPVTPVIYDVRARHARVLGDPSWRFHPWTLPTPSFFVGAHVLVRGGVGLEAMLAHAQSHPLACAGSADGLRAFAVANARLAGGTLQAMLARLAAQEGEALPPLAVPEFAWCAAPYGGAYPWAAREPGARAPRRYDDAEHLNAALAEILGDRDGSPSRAWQAAADDLARLREKSRAPWILNELLCDIEHRAAVAAPRSHPPELHLSTSAACNTECRFCSYSHAEALRHHVSPDELLAQPFLRFVRTLRLHSGNGEPTLNPQLPRIVQALRETHPHIGLNFSTNGILLGREGLAEALAGGNVNWVNVSLNASNAERWSEYAEGNHFERIRAGMRRLAAAKRAARSAEPLAFTSLVLTRHSIRDLPGLPALAAELGAVKVTGIPFSSLGYAHLEDRYGTKDAYHASDVEYAAAYDRAVAEAERLGITVELPLPSHDAARFGVEARPMRDFAGLDENQWRVAALVSGVDVPAAGREACPSLWRLGAVTHAQRDSAGHHSHYLYPCLGPLGSVDLSAVLGFSPGVEGAFENAWRDPVMHRLREAQQAVGRNPVCDRCRGCDSRAPGQIRQLERLLEDYCRGERLPLPGRKERAPIRVTARKAARPAGPPPPAP